MEALVALHQAGRLRRAWLPGMRFRSNVNGFTFRLHEDTSPPPADRFSPVLTDPATEGCLRALLREAARDVYLKPELETPKGYLMWWFPGLTGSHDTEAEAIAFALIALAEQLPCP